MSLKIGKALEVILRDVKIPYKVGKLTKHRTLQTHYGDQFELNKWVGIQDASNRVKYPLAYYALNNDYTERKGWVKSKVTLILLTTAEYSELNGKRLSDNYETILYPLRDIVKKRLLTNSNVVMYGALKTRFKEVDEPLMGISNEDFSKLRDKTKSVTTDIVDAIILKFEAEFNIECI